MSRWPHSGHTTMRKTGRRRQTTSDIRAGQTTCAQVARRRDTHYGSDAHVVGSQPGSTGAPGAKTTYRTTHLREPMQHGTESAAGVLHVYDLPMKGPQSAHLVTDSELRRD